MMDELVDGGVILFRSFLIQIFLRGRNHVAASAKLHCVDSYYLWLYVHLHKGKF
jgi:hypothetical protein